MGKSELFERLRSLSELPHGMLAASGPLINPVILQEARRVRRAVLAQQDFCGTDSKLTGACFISSYALLIRLQDRKVHARLVDGSWLDSEGLPESCHYWVETESHIIDVTATQFGKHPAVKVVPIDHPRYQSGHKTRERYPQRYMRRHGWGKFLRDECEGMILKILSQLRSDCLRFGVDLIRNPNQ